MNHLIYTMDSQPTDKVEGVGDDFVRGGQDQTPITQKRKRIVVSAGTPTVIVNEGNEQYSAPWTDESPGGTVRTSAYKDGKKRCLSAKGGSGDPKKKVLKQNNTFMKAHRKSGGRDLTEEEIRAEAHKRQKEMGDAARAAEMTKEEVALEKRKGLADKEAARKAATGQAGTVKRAAEEAARKAATGQAGTVKRAAEEAARRASTGQAGKDKRARVEAKRWAESGQADKDKHAGVEAKRWAASGQADKDKHAGVEATRWAKKNAAAATALEEAAAKQRQSRQEQRELYAQLTRKTHETHGAAPRTPFEFRPTFEFNRAASVRAAQQRAAYIAQRKSRRAIAAAQFAPRKPR
jgi:hypothetical protein